MRKNNLILAIFLIVGISAAYYLWSHKSDATLTPIETVAESSNETEKPNENVAIQDKLKQNKANTSQLKRLLVGRVQAFDPDPAVDAELIKINLNHCIKLMNPDKHREEVKSWKSIDKQSDSQIKYKQGLNDYCESINSKHPEYMLTNEEDIKVLRGSMASDNETGKILSKFYKNKNIDLETFDMASKIQHLKNTNPNLLLAAAYYFSPYLIEKLQYDVADIINSNDFTYIDIVRKRALDLYACNAGANCGAQSNRLALLCLNQNLCGNDYNDIIYNKMPEGIRADILLVFNHLKKSFD